MGVHSDGKNIPYCVKTPWRRFSLNDLRKDDSTGLLRFRSIVNSIEDTILGRFSIFDLFLPYSYHLE